MAINVFDDLNLHRDLDGEQTSFAHLRLHLDGTSQQVDETFHHGEAVAAAFRDLAAAVGSHKRLEDFIQLVVRDADAGILHAEHQTSHLEARLESDAALDGIFDGVGNQIADDLLDLQLVGIGKKTRPDLVFEVEHKVLLVGDGLEHRSRFFAQLFHVERLFLHLKHTLFQS